MDYRRRYLRLIGRRVRGLRCSWPRRLLRGTFQNRPGPSRKTAWQLADRCPVSNAPLTGDCGGGFINPLQRQPFGRLRGGLFYGRDSNFFRLFIYAGFNRGPGLGCTSVFGWAWIYGRLDSTSYRRAARRQHVA